MGITATMSRQWRQRRALVLLLAALAVWLVVGALRAPAVARDYLAGFNAGTHDVKVEAVFPVVPPLWVVSVSGQVPINDAEAYTSAMILVVEPFSGTVFTWASG